MGCGDQDWKDKLEADSVVIMRTRHGSTLRVVDRTTKTHIIMKDGSRYRRSTGKMIGGDTWTYNHIMEATPEAVDVVRKEVRIANITHDIKRVDWSTLSSDTLEKIYEILKL